MTDAKPSKHHQWTEQDKRLLAVFLERHDVKTYRMITDEFNEAQGTSVTPREVREQMDRLRKAEFVYEWTEEEDEQLKKWFAEFGPRWSIIAQVMCLGMSGNMIRNHYNQLAWGKKSKTLTPQVVEPTTPPPASGWGNAPAGSGWGTTPPSGWPTPTINEPITKEAGRLSKKQSK